MNSHHSAARRLMLLTEELASAVLQDQHLRPVARAVHATRDDMWAGRRHRLVAPARSWQTRGSGRTGPTFFMLRTEASAGKEIAISLLDLKRSSDGRHRAYGPSSAPYDLTARSQRLSRPPTHTVRLTRAAGSRSPASTPTLRSGMPRPGGHQQPLGPVRGAGAAGSICGTHGGGERASQ